MRSHLRAAAFLTLLCFVTTSMVWGVPPQEILPSLTGSGFLQLEIPGELASIEEMFEAPPSPDSKLILHIQNVHGNYEAQTQIKRLLGYLQKTYGFNLIFVEGAAEKLDPKYLKLFPDEENNKRLAEELAKSGALTGPELFILEEPPKAEAVGIEQTDLYRADYEAFKKVYGEKENSDWLLDHLNSRLELLSSRFLSQDARRLLSEWKKFEAGHRDFLPYVERLSKDARKLIGLDLASLFSQVEWPQLTRLLVLQQMEKELDREKAEKEKAKLTEFLTAKGVSKQIVNDLGHLGERRITMHKMASAGADLDLPRYLLERLAREAVPKGFHFHDYPAFSLYAGYLILQSELDSRSLFNEIEILFDKILAAVTPSEREKNLLELFRDLDLLTKLLHLELSRKEWTRAAYRKDWLVPASMLRRIQAIEEEAGGPVSTLPIPQNSSLIPFETALNFYDLARQRENVFFDKIQSEMAARQTDKAVLVTGGFHTDGIADLLRENAINYGILMPRLNQKMDNVNYIANMLERQPTRFDLATVEAPVFSQSMGAMHQLGAEDLKHYKFLMDKYLSAARFPTSKSLRNAIEKFNADAKQRRLKIRMRLLVKEKAINLNLFGRLYKIPLKKLSDGRVAFINTAKRSEMRFDIASINQDIQQLETRIKQIGIPAIPTIGFHGQAPRENASYFYFAFKSYSSFEQDSKMGDKEFLERFQGTILSAINYSEFDFSRGQNPVVDLLTTKKQFDLFTSNEKSRTNTQLVFDYPSDKYVYFKYFPWEGSIAASEVPEEAKHRISLIPKEISWIQGQALALAKPSVGLTNGMIEKYLVFRMFYQKSLSELLNIVQASRSELRKEGGTTGPTEALVPTFPPERLEMLQRAKQLEQDADVLEFLGGQHVLQMFQEALSLPQAVEVRRAMSSDSDHSEGLRLALGLRALELAKSSRKQNLSAIKIALLLNEELGRVAQAEDRYGLFNSVGSEYEVMISHHRNATAKDASRSFRLNAAKKIYGELLGGRYGLDEEIEYAIPPAYSWTVQETIRSSMLKLELLPQNDYYPWNSMHVSGLYTKNFGKVEGIQRMAKFIMFANAVLNAHPDRIRYFGAAGWRPLDFKGGVGNVQELPGKKPKDKVEEDTGEKERLEYRLADSTSAQTLQMLHTLHGLMLQTVGTSAKLRISKDAPVNGLERELILAFNHFFEGIQTLLRQGAAGTVATNLLSRNWFEAGDDEFSRLTMLQRDVTFRAQLMAVIETTLSRVEKALDQIEVLQEQSVSPEEVARIPVVSLLLQQIRTDRAATEIIVDQLRYSDPSSLASLIERHITRVSNRDSDALRRGILSSMAQINPASVRNRNFSDLIQRIYYDSALETGFRLRAEDLRRLFSPSNRIQRLQAERMRNDQEQFTHRITDLISRPLIQKKISGQPFDFQIIHELLQRPGIFRTDPSIQQRWLKKLQDQIQENFNRPQIDFRGFNIQRMQDVLREAARNLPMRIQQVEFLPSKQTFQKILLQLKAFPNRTAWGFMGFMTASAIFFVSILSVLFGGMDAAQVMSTSFWGAVAGLAMAMVAWSHAHDLRRINRGDFIDPNLNPLDPNIIPILESRIRNLFDSGRPTQTSVSVVLDVVAIGVAAFQNEHGGNELALQMFENDGFYFDRISHVLYLNQEKFGTSPFFVDIRQHPLVLNSLFVNGILFNILFIHKQAAVSDRYHLGLVLAHEKGKRAFFESVFYKNPWLKKWFGGWRTAELYGKTYETLYVLGFGRPARSEMRSKEPLDEGSVRSETRSNREQTLAQLNKAAEIVDRLLEELPESDQRTEAQKLRGFYNGLAQDLRDRALKLRKVTDQTFDQINTQFSEPNNHVDLVLDLLSRNPPHSIPSVLRLFAQSQVGIGNLERLVRKQHKEVEELEAKLRDKIAREIEALATDDPALLYELAKSVIEEDFNLEKTNLTEAERAALEQKYHLIHQGKISKEVSSLILLGVVGKGAGVHFDLNTFQSNLAAIRSRRSEMRTNKSENWWQTAKHDKTISIQDLPENSRLRKVAEFFQDKKLTGIMITGRTVWGLFVQDENEMPMMDDESKDDVDVVFRDRSQIAEFSKELKVSYSLDDLINGKEAVITEQFDFDLRGWFEKNGSIHTPLGESRNLWDWPYFSINKIGFVIEADGQGRWLDPYHGIEDARNRVLRWFNPANTPLSLMNVMRFLSIYHGFSGKAGYQVDEKSFQEGREQIRQAFDRNNSKRSGTVKSLEENLTSAKQIRQLLNELSSAGTRRKAWFKFLVLLKIYSLFAKRTLSSINADFRDGYYKLSFKGLLSAPNKLLLIDSPLKSLLRQLNKVGWNQNSSEIIIGHNFLGYTFPLSAVLDLRKEAEKKQPFGLGPVEVLHGLHRVLSYAQDGGKAVQDIIDLGGGWIFENLGINTEELISDWENLHSNNFSRILAYDQKISGIIQERTSELKNLDTILSLSRSEMRSKTPPDHTPGRNAEVVIDPLIESIINRIELGQFTKADRSELRSKDAQYLRRRHDGRELHILAGQHGTPELSNLLISKVAPMVVSDPTDWLFLVEGKGLALLEAEMTGTMASDFGVPIEDPIIPLVSRFVVDRYLLKHPEKSLLDVYSLVAIDLIVLGLKFTGKAPDQVLRDVAIDSQELSSTQIDRHIKRRLSQLQSAQDKKALNQEINRLIEDLLSISNILSRQVISYLLRKYAKKRKILISIGRDHLPALKTLQEVEPLYQLSDDEVQAALSGLAKLRETRKSKRELQLEGAVSPTGPSDAFGRFRLENSRQIEEIPLNEARRIVAQVDRQTFKIKKIWDMQNDTLRLRTIVYDDHESGRTVHFIFEGMPNETEVPDGIHIFKTSKTTGEASLSLGIPKQAFLALIMQAKKAKIYTLSSRSEMRIKLDVQIQELMRTVTDVNVTQARESWNSNEKVRNFESTLQKLQTMAADLAEAYSRRLTDAGIEVRRMRIYLVGGMVRRAFTNQDEHVSDSSDIDLIIRWDPEPSVRQVSIKEISPLLAQSFYEVIEGLHIPASLNEFYSARARETSPLARELDDYYMRRVKSLAGEEKLSEPKYENLAAIDIQGWQGKIPEGENILNKEESMLLVASYDSPAELAETQRVAARSEMRTMNLREFLGLSATATLLVPPILVGKVWPEDGAEQDETGEDIPFRRLSSSAQDLISQNISWLYDMAKVKNNLTMMAEFEGTAWKEKLFILPSSDREGKLHGGGMAWKGKVFIDQGTLEWALKGDPAAAHIFIRTLFHEFAHHVHAKDKRTFTDPSRPEENITRLETAEFFGDKVYVSSNGIFVPGGHVRKGNDGNFYNDTNEKIPYAGSNDIIFSVYLVRDESGAVQFFDDGQGLRHPLIYINAYPGQILDRIINEAKIIEIRESLEDARQTAESKNLLQKEIDRLTDQINTTRPVIRSFSIQGQDAKFTVTFPQRGRYAIDASPNLRWWMTAIPEIVIDKEGETREFTHPLEGQPTLFYRVNYVGLTSRSEMRDGLEFERLGLSSLLKQNSVLTPGVVIDAGSRDGRYTKLLFELGATNVLSVDPSLEAFPEDIASDSRISRIPKKLQEVVPQDMIGLSTVDHIVAFNCLLPLDERNKFLFKAIDLLKPEGSMVVTFVEAEIADDFLTRAEALQGIRIKVKDASRLSNHMGHRYLLVIEKTSTPQWNFIPDSHRLLHSKNAGPFIPSAARPYLRFYTPPGSVVSINLPSLGVARSEMQRQKDTGGQAPDTSRESSVVSQRSADTGPGAPVIPSKARDLRKIPRLRLGMTTSFPKLPQFIQALEEKGEFAAVVAIVGGGVFKPGTSQEEIEKVAEKILGQSRSKLREEIKTFQLQILKSLVSSATSEGTESSQTVVLLLPKQRQENPGVNPKTLMDLFFSLLKHTNQIETLYVTGHISEEIPKELTGKVQPITQLMRLPKSLTQKWLPAVAGVPLTKEMHLPDFLAPIELSEMEELDEETKEALAALQIVTAVHLARIANGKKLLSDEDIQLALMTTLALDKNFLDLKKLVDIRTENGQTSVTISGQIAQAYIRHLAREKAKQAA